MIEKSVTEKADKQRDYIAFLEQVLNVCIVFKEKLNAGYTRIFFREKDASHDWYEVQEEGWGNRLSFCVYNSIASGTNLLEISQSMDGKEHETIPITDKLSIVVDDIPHDTDKDYPERQISEILKTLPDRYISEKVISRLERDSSNFFGIRHQILENETVFSLSKREIGAYLSAYYALLNSYIICYDSLDQSGENDVFIDTLLHLDSKFDEGSGNCLFSFWNPIVLNKMQKVNHGIELFFKQITEENTVKSAMMQRIYRRTLLTKAQHTFRWYVTGAKHELLHAAIAPYVEVAPTQLTFQVAANNLKRYNSYEGIGELRLGEKIIYEYGLIQQSNPQSFCIAIVGDLHATPLKQLYYYVVKKLEERYGRDPVFKFNIYTKNFLNQDVLKDIPVFYHGSSQEILASKSKLGEVIDSNNIVFLLDCIELYNSPTILEKEDLEFIKQRYVFSTYDEYNLGFMKEVDICNSNALEELYEIVTAKQCFGQFSRIGKSANNALLEFCEKKQKEKGKESSIYVYVSDLHAFNDIYNDDQYYIRKEQYNQKEIGIIRYSSEKITKLKVNGKNMMLVFNMWQFIKTVAIDEKNMFWHGKNANEKNYMELDKIYIGIDYSKWPSLFEVHYYCKDQKLERIATKFINAVLLPILNNRSQDMFNTYIRKAMCSFFYSAAQSVNDMLFIHLFQDKEEFLGRMISAENNDPKKVESNINKHFKYSIKRFYDMIIKNYDISSKYYVGQMKTSYIIQKNEISDANIDKRDIYSNVIEACGNLLYENSFLAKNCKREL